MSARQRRKRDKRRRQAARRAGAGRRIAFSAGLGVAAALGTAGSAQAAVDMIEVTVDDDPAADGCMTSGCTLREAITQADDGDTVDQDVITFNASITGEITLGGSQLPLIDEPLSIQGPGAGLLTVSGNNLSRILDINTALAPVSVSVSDLTLSAGSAAVGAAIAKVNADLTVQDSVISGNSATGTTAYGGAISSVEGSTTILDSTISGNSAIGDPASSGYAAGGGVYIHAGSAATIMNSTISGNSASAPSAEGGGLRIGYVGTATIQSSTVSGNSSTGTAGSGAGIQFRRTSATVESSTIADNSASSFGGGIETAFATAEPALSNTIVADNSASSSGADLRSAGTPFDTFNLSFSLVENTSDAPINNTVAGSNIFGVDPELDPLGSNGGPTDTQALAETSPAIDCGSSGGATTDQRGAPFSRPVDLAGRTNSTATGADGADIGAFELQAGAASGACTSNAPPPQPPTATPSNDIDFGEVDRNTKNGTATITVIVPGAGEISLGGSGIAQISLASASRQVAAGPVELKVRPAKGKKGRKVRRSLRQKGKATVKAQVTFVPNGGTANTETTKVKLVKK